jgi:hypothetical protein
MSPNCKNDEPIPISLLLDDSCPLVHVYRYHRVDVDHREPSTTDGRRLLDTIPNSFLDRFCDVVGEHGISGKFSIVPEPAGLGSVDRGITGFDPALTTAWNTTVQRRLPDRWDFSPEGLTHNLAVNLATGKSIEQGESAWSQSQNRETLTPYLARGLSRLKNAGFDASGVTSPWVFGIQVEPEYAAAIAAAQQEVYGRNLSWYFLHGRTDQPGIRPVISHQDPAPGPRQRTVVSIPATIDDAWWRTIDSPEAGPEFANQVADRLLTADGRLGAIRAALDRDSWPILVTHWQSLFSNGLETGLLALDELGRRVTQCLGAEVRWTTCLEMARTVTGVGA